MRYRELPTFKLGHPGAKTTGSTNTTILYNNIAGLEVLRVLNWGKKAAGLLLSLRVDRCSKFHNSSSRTLNLEVEDFMERCFSYLQVVFRSRGGSKAARALKRTISKTVQIWEFTASTSSRCFERVSHIEIEPNEPHAYAKNRWTPNKLSLGILENFARVSFRFSRVGNLQHPNK